jgi:phosphoribosylaminoimidazolecarboxamide formyltransferase / IMP cyclohydrolase
MKRTALISVYDKTGVVEFARKLIGLGFTILGSRGTTIHLMENGVLARDVATIVGEPILGHRVVTLSREIHAGLLAQNTPEDIAELARIGVPMIDLVYVNMYPLAEEIAKRGHTLMSVIEKTDIGGPCMLRSAAKGRRIVMCQPEQIPVVLERIQRHMFMDGGQLPDVFISHLVAEAENEVSVYCSYSADFHADYAEITPPPAA